MDSNDEALRQAFKAGWRTNASHEDAKYLDGCEAADWAEFNRLGLVAYLASLAATESEAMPTKCACRSEDAYQCWEERYGPRDWESGEVDMDGGPCECSCHDDAEGRS